MDMPNINLVAIGQLFTVVLLSLASVWGVNKAIIFAKKFN